jgi:catechol 2,3-dioxygenase-like lactoylglutathione lyase family enzyme
MAEFPAPQERIVLTHFIVSDDVERSRRFYTEVLGVERRGSKAFKRAGVSRSWVRLRDALFSRGRDAGEVGRNRVGELEGHLDDLGGEAERARPGVRLTTALRPDPGRREGAGRRPRPSRSRTYW